MNLINICLYLYFILKPFYLGASGSLQISDAFILIAFFLTVLEKNKNKNEIVKQNLYNFKYIIFFVLSVILINSIYSIFYDMKSFFMSTLYYIFILMGIYTFIYKVGDKKFLKNIYSICLFNIILQIIMLIFDIGEYYGKTRYMGSFNDPNQFGFFIVLMLMYMYILKNILNTKSNIFKFVFLLGIYLIFESASTGMILAIGTFLIFQVICRIKEIGPALKKYKSKIIISIVTIILILSMVFLIYILDENVAEKINKWISDNIFESSMYRRLRGKLEGVEESKLELLEDRHLEQIINNPQYLIFGAGQGEFGRFTNYTYIGEIHSTLPSIMFYYGLVPTLILLYWIYRNLKGIHLKNMSVYIAIAIESFTLLNQRQLLLWVLFILANTLKEINNEKSYK